MEQMQQQPQHELQTTHPLTLQQMELQMQRMRQVMQQMCEQMQRKEQQMQQMQQHMVKMGEQMHQMHQQQLKEDVQMLQKMHQMHQSGTAPTLTPSGQLLGENFWSLSNMFTDLAAIVSQDLAIGDQTPLVNGAVAIGCETIEMMRRHNAMRIEKPPMVQDDQGAAYAWPCRNG